MPSNQTPGGIPNVVDWSMISVVSILVTVWFALAYKIPENTIQIGREWRPTEPVGSFSPVELRITCDGSYVLDDQHVSTEYLAAEIRVASSKRHANWVPLLLLPTADSPAGALVKAISIGHELRMNVVVGVPPGENEISVTNLTRQPCKTKQSS